MVACKIISKFGSNTILYAKTCTGCWSSHLLTLVAKPVKSNGPAKFAPRLSPLQIASIGRIQGGGSAAIDEHTHNYPMCT